MSRRDNNTFCEFIVNRPVIDNRGCAKCIVGCRLLAEKNETSPMRPGPAGPRCQIIRLYTLTVIIYSDHGHRGVLIITLITRVEWTLWVDDCLSVCLPGWWWWWSVAESSAVLQCDDIVSTVHFRCCRSASRVFLISILPLSAVRRPHTATALR